MWPAPSTLAADQFPHGSTFTNSLEMSFVRIAAGEFSMGSGAAPPTSLEQWERRDWGEAPAHRVNPRVT